MVESVSFLAVGFPEMILLTMLTVLLAILTGKWIYEDASARGSDWAWQWGVGVGSLFLLGVLPGVLAVTTYAITTRI